MSVDAKVLIINTVGASFERFICNGIMAYGADVLDTDAISGGLQGLNAIEKQKKVYSRLKQAHTRYKIEEYELIIVFEAVSFIPALRLLKSKKCKLVLWQWNHYGVEGKSLKYRLARKVCEIWTYDQFDAAQHDWKLNTNFYFNKTCTFPKPNNQQRKAFFVGLDKGRVNTLCELRRILEPCGIEPEFYVVGQKDAVYSGEEKRWIHSQGMEYEEIVKSIQECEYIVDLAKCNPCGYTFRIMEGLYFGKKIITNNDVLLNTDIYLTNNVFVFGHDNSQRWEEFVNQEAATVDKQLLEKYDFENWIKRFLDES